MAENRQWMGFRFRATRAWLDWLRRLARHAGTSTSDAVGRGLALLAASVGFEPPPPRN